MITLMNTLLSSHGIDLVVGTCSVMLPPTPQQNRTTKFYNVVRGNKKGAKVMPFVILTQDEQETLNKRAPKSSKVDTKPYCEDLSQLPLGVWVELQVVDSDKDSTIKREMSLYKKAAKELQMELRFKPRVKGQKPADKDHPNAATAMSITQRKLEDGTLELAPGYTKRQYKDGKKPGRKSKNKSAEAPAVTETEAPAAPTTKKSKKLAAA